MSQLAAIESERLQQLHDIITDILELEPGELTDTSDFIDEHDADSLMAIDIIARIEREMGVRIPNEALPEMVNLQAVVGLVSRYAR
jgi:acyl carrier protein